MKQPQAFHKLVPLKTSERIVKLGKPGEYVLDTDLNIVFRWDGTTNGGVPLIQGIADRSGNEAILAVAVALAVNYLTASGGITGKPAILGAAGDDANVGLRLQPKGTGVVQPNPLGPLTKSMGAGVHADVTLTADEASYACIIAGGTPDAGVNLIVPNRGLYVVTNTSGQAVTVKTAAGAGIAIANTKSAIIAANGVDCIRITADT